MYNIRVVAVLLWLIGACTGASAAESFQPPQLHAAQINWREALADLAAGSADPATQPAAALTRLNDAVAGYFPNIANSAVPVLLPIDSDALLRDQAAGETQAIESYLAGFKPTEFFLPGPSGYDAVFAFQPGGVPGFTDIKLAYPVLVTISGFAFLYELASPVGRIEMPLPDLDADFPGLRRQILESALRYSFERYGVPYVVSIQCHDRPQTMRRLSCRNADRIAQRFLRALRLAGGTEPAAAATIKAPVLERPKDVSTVFTYYPAGSLIPGSGMKGRNGKPDATVYARIRFPLADAPAYANSQSFMHWGDCDQTGRRPWPRRKDAPYRCRVNSKPLVFNEAAPENYSYPWRDNFCEHRHFFVGQCPSGQGHQGQDIRPATCKLRNDGADRCEAYLDDTVAVRDGMILRENWHESFLLHVNTANERLRFRYLHMHPRQMNQARIFSGRAVREGDVLGKVGNFNRRDRGTSYHLHFEMEVPTRDGWVRVNPYMTLVAAYEHLIQARGVEIMAPDEDPEDVTNSAEATASKAERPRKKTSRLFPKGRKKRR